MNENLNANSESVLNVLDTLCVIHRYFDESNQLWKKEQIEIAIKKVENCFPDMI